MWSLYFTGALLLFLRNYPGTCAEDHDLIVNLSRSKNGSSVISKDPVHLDVCEGKALTTNFTCKVEGKPQNDFLPRICVQQSNNLSCISPRDSIGLENKNIVMLQISQNCLRFQQMITETEAAHNMLIYCELENISSNQIKYREVTCVQPGDTTPPMLPNNTESDVNTTGTTTPTSDPDSPSPTGPFTESNVGIIVGIAVVLTIFGVVLVAVVVIATAYILYRYLRRHQVANPSNPSQSKFRRCWNRVCTSFGIEETPDDGENSVNPEHPSGRGDYAREHGQYNDVFRGKNQNDRNAE